MTIIKRVVCMMLICTMVLSVPCEADARVIDKHGFTYDTSDYTVTWKQSYKTYVYSEEGGLLGTLTYHIGMARLNGTNDYNAMIKLIMTPNDSKVKRKGSSYGYGLSEYVSFKTYVPGVMGEYSPENLPDNGKIGLSFGVDSSGLALGVDYTVDVSDIDIYADCYETTNRARFVYNYLPSIANPFADNTYVAKQSSQYAMFQFETSKSDYEFAVTTDVRFGASEDNDSSPWYIYMNYVRQTVKTMYIKWTLK